MDAIKSNWPVAASKYTKWVLGNLLSAAYITPVGDSIKILNLVFLVYIDDTHYTQI